ncbi:MAG: hypothetical protein ABI882_10295 [Acidobacteriota bacterium]
MQLLSIVVFFLILSISANGQTGTATNGAQDRTFSGRLTQPAPSEKPRPVRNGAARLSEEVITLRYFKIRKGSFDQFLRASVEGVWPYFEKIGARVIGMWQVVTPEGVDGGPQASKDFDEVYLSTRYASVDHWKATRDAVSLGGNGPDWDKCKAALDLRQSLTITSSVIFLKGQMAAGGPYFLPGLDETYEKKNPK